MVPPVNLAPYILQCESRIVMTSAQGESMTFVSTRWVNDLCPYKVSQWPLSLQGEPMTLWLLLKVSQWPKVPPVNTSPYILNCESRMFITSAQSESMTFVQYKMRQWPYDFYSIWVNDLLWISKVGVKNVNTSDNIAWSTVILRFLRSIQRSEE